MVDSRAARRALALALAAGLTGAAARAEQPPEAANLAEAFTKGKPSLALRYRFESVSDDAFVEDGNASTLRAALGFSTLSWHRLVAFVELQSVADLGLEDSHNNGGEGGYANGITSRPIIADPEITRAQQYGIRTTWIPRTTLGIGRQEIGLGNERFVGIVAFRQNHQSFDAARVDTRALDTARFSYSYLARVHTVKGASKGLDGHALYGEVDVMKAGTVGLYGFLLDYDAAADAGSSSGSWGVLWRGNPALSDGWSIPYRVEFAQQSDAGLNPTDYVANYLFLEAGFRSELWDLRVGYEELGSDHSTAAFSTPLATLFKFNGWADKFQTTPLAGLEDLYLSAAFTKGSWTATIVGHEFSADDGDGDFGSELDARLEWRAKWKQVVGAQVAIFSADDFSTDATKIWLYTSWGF